MTSPRQRKKRLAFLKQKEKEQQNSKPVVSSPAPIKPVAATPPAVVESAVEPAKAKKPTKNALVEVKAEETKSQDQVVEQPKQEVKTSKGE
jgi:hypothetical protein